MKLLQNFSPQLRVAKALALTAVLLALFLALNLAHSRAAATQELSSGSVTYLPLVTQSGNATPTGTYAQALQQVKERCANTAINQVCYVSGQVTLQPKSGTVVPFSQPGDIANLDNVQSLSLSTNGANNQPWSMAWLRLRAESAAPNQEVTILAFGSVQISHITLFTGVANPTAETTLPGLRFTSSPVSGVNKLGSSGLIVTNPADDELLSLTLNGAALTLGSVALAETQPGSKMNITMAAGTSLTDVNGEGTIAAQNYRVTVPLNQAGVAAAPPGPAVLLSDDEYWQQHFDDLIRQLDDAIALANAILARLNQSLDRCIQGRAASVYNVLYWVRVIESSPHNIKFLMNQAGLTFAYNRVPNCLSFEVDFVSNVTTTAAVVFEASHLQMEGMPVQFLVNGGYIAINTSLDYVSYEYILSQSCGTVITEVTGGMMELAGGSLTISGNRVRIDTTLRVVTQPTDVATLHCPPAPPLVISHGHWVPIFYHVHEDLLQSDLASFRFQDWRYTANSAQCDGSSSAFCPHVGEAIYERSLSEGPLVMNTATHLILVHTPEQ